jgi:sugar phosphate isomerase/epimerase
MRTQLAFIGQDSLQGVEEDAAFCVQHGFEGLEFNYWGNFEQLSEDTVRRTADILATYGVKCVMFGLWGWNHLAPDPAERQQAHAMLRRAIAFGQILKADVLTTGGGVCSAVLAENVAEFNKVFPPFLQDMAAAALRPAFYAVHGKSFFDCIEAYEQVWETLPQVGIKYDPANWRHHGADYLAVLRRYGNKVAHLHIKEHLYHHGELASQPAAGMGDIEWGKVFAFLYEHGYTGPLSIEPHGPIWSQGEMRRKLLLLTQRAISPLLI